MSKKIKACLKASWARPEPGEPGAEPIEAPIIATALPANTCPRSPIGLGSFSPVVTLKVIPAPSAQSNAFFNGPIAIY